MIDDYQPDLARLYAIADEAIAAGMEVLPAAVWLKDDGTLDKAPLLPHGHLQAHRERQRIRQELADVPHVPDDVPAMFELVVGIRPGPAGFVALDADVKHGKAGKESLESLVAAHGNFVTSAWRSPSGGVNVLLRKPPGAAYSNHPPWDGIDVRADAGWMVAPGNTCVGGAWEWTGGSSYSTASPLPAAMAEQLRASSEGGRKATNAEAVDFIEASPTDSSLSVMQKFREQREQFRRAGTGSRHDALVRIVGWSFGMEHLDLRWALELIRADWRALTAGEGREDEVNEVACWVAGQELAKRAAEDQQPSQSSSAGEPDDWRGLIVDGRAWLRSGSTKVVTVWGDSVDALMARLQPTLLVGETGAGKTTLVHHLILGAIGLPAYLDVLGWPVRVLPEGERVLYLAADRPDQARLAMLRHFADDDDKAWQLVEDRLRVWRGPPPASLAHAPGLLLEMAGATNAGLVIVDSSKDMASNLSDDKVGSAVNQAHQLVVASGRDLIALHHPRKRGREQVSDRPTLDDGFGSNWIVAGSGSVLFLIQEPHSTEVLQLKTPNGRQSNFRFRIDPSTGALVPANDDILAAVVSAGSAGISTRQVAIWATGVANPTEAQVERVRRRLKVLDATGSITTIGTGKTTRWIQP